MAGPAAGVWLHPGRNTIYLTVMVTVAELGSVSVPPGPKLTLPMTLNTALDVPAAGVTF